MGILKQILAGLAGALVIGAIMALVFTSYGGNRCDQPPDNTCDCFCCNSFGLRGYESCAWFGLYSGLFIGGAAGLAALRIYRKK